MALKRTPFIAPYFTCRYSVGHKIQLCITSTFRVSHILKILLLLTGNKQRKRRPSWELKWLIMHKNQRILLMKGHYIGLITPMGLMDPIIQTLMSFHMILEIQIKTLTHMGEWIQMITDQGTISMKVPVLHECLHGEKDVWIFCDCLKWIIHLINLTTSIMLYPDSWHLYGCGYCILLCMCMYEVIKW